MSGPPLARLLRLLVASVLLASISTSHSVGIDPVADGAFVQVFNPSSGESACFALPASGWFASGPPDPPFYTYRDLGFVHGPCHRALVKSGRRPKLTVTCSARVQPIPFSLDEPQQGSLAVVLRSGGATYCAEFGGTIVGDSSAEDRFVAKKSPRPAACATPPAPCP